MRKSNFSKIYKRIKFKNNLNKLSKNSKVKNSNNCNQLAKTQNKKPLVLTQCL
jgi:hypothetical protein